MGTRYAKQLGCCAPIIGLGHRDGDNVEFAFVELVSNPCERDMAQQEDWLTKTANMMSARSEVR